MVIRPGIRRGTLLHVEDGTDRAPGDLLWSVSLEEANPCADEEKHTQMMSREGKIERKVARGSVCLMTAS
jgi:hypothetical protein